MSPFLDDLVTMQNSGWKVKTNFRFGPNLFAAVVHPPGKKPCKLAAVILRRLHPPMLACLDHSPVASAIMLVYTDHFPIL
jgi:hypothetical protein